MASGNLDGTRGLRQTLEVAGLSLEEATWQALDDSEQRPAGTLSIASDDVLVAVADAAPEEQVHSAWHRIRLETGPYAVEGDLATLPGFDPGRALARPSGEFLLLRDVRVSVLDRPAWVATTDHALVNRYTVERVEADLMLGFFFPGAAQIPIGPASEDPAS
jgi:hypothetical protein